MFVWFRQDYKQNNVEYRIFNNFIYVYKSENRWRQIPHYPQREMYSAVLGIGTLV